MFQFSAPSWFSVIYFLFKYLFYIHLGSNVSQVNTSLCTNIYSNHQPWLFQWYSSRGMWFWKPDLYCMLQSIWHCINQGFLNLSLKFVPNAKSGFHFLILWDLQKWLKLKYGGFKVIRFFSGWLCTFQGTILEYLQYVYVCIYIYISTVHCSTLNELYLKLISVAGIRMIYTGSTMIYLHILQWK